MTLNLEMPQAADLRPRITVFGVGGAGCNAVNNMIAKDLDGVDFVVANTDAQALKMSKAPVKIQLGEKMTEGLGAGAQPEVGAAAAEESMDTIIDHLAGAHMCFITAGMGGGTGTGAAPIIAQAARELGILTVGVITKPFQFEGRKRADQADKGVEALEEMVDTLIMIPNQNLFRIANEKTTFTDAFSMADDVLYHGVKGVTDLMVRPGIINLDFADIRVVMNEMGKAMMGTGEAEGEERAVQAAERAINNPLLDEISLDGAKGVLINITGGSDLTLFEVDEAANKIRDRVDPDANIWVGSALDDELAGKIRVSVVATGIDAKEGAGEMPVPRRTLKSPLPLRVEDIKEHEAELEADPIPEAVPEPAPFNAQAAVPEPSFEPSYDDDEEPSLFDVPDFAPAADAEDMYVEEAPAGPSFTRAESAEYQAEPAPSRETLQRLRAAVDKEPPAYDPNRHHQQSNVTPLPEVEPQPARKGVFGSLIGRMTGQAEEETAPQHYRQEPSLRDEPGDYARDYDGIADDDQVDVPAFLRRQAN